jgi:D-glycero-D-manno-heptose 1,7-bisphosphate phosphatase
MSEHAALFVDRDGVLVEVVRRGREISSARSWEEFRPNLAAQEVLSQARQAGYKTVLITNQPDVARGKLSEELLTEFHHRLGELFELDALEVCPHDDTLHPRRKPNPGMILEAAERLQLDLARSFVLGDSAKDVEAGKRAGVRTILIQTDYNQTAQSQADYLIQDVRQALTILLNAQEANR